MSILGVSLLGVGCGGGRPQAGGELPGDETCIRIPGDPEPGATITFSLAGAVRPRVPAFGRSDAEAVLLRLLRPTLTRTACDGSAAPALAGRWTTDESAWVFHDLPAAVIDAHVANDESIPFRRDLRATRGPTPGSLRVTAESEDVDVPTLLAHPAFGLPREPQRSLPDPYLWSPDTDRAGTVASIRFLFSNGRDPRDEIDERVDAFVVRRRDRVAWFERSGDYVATRLAWSPVHWLLTADDELAALMTDETITDLAARVVRSEARPAEGVRAIYRMGSERRPPPNPVPARPLPRVVVPIGDEDALALAERTIALAPPGRDLVVEALGPRAMLRSLAAGDAVAWVYPQRHRSPRPPIVRREILEAAPWITTGGGHAIPLVETRAVLFTRPGLVGIDCGPDGVPRLERGGWERGAAARPVDDS